MRAIAHAIGALFIVSQFLSGCSMSSDKSSVPHVTVEQLHQKANSDHEIYLLDVRTEPEFLTERLQFADERIPFDSLGASLDLLPADKNAEIYTFCRSGRRSAIAAGYLRSVGYTRVFNVEGGINAWKAAGYETVSGR
ncbi:MAG: rhodanese-like domain-containing protein [Candidatus Zixiibacteriota bacterium]